MKNNFVKKISKTLETILYYPKKFIPLHEPTFFLNEKSYLDNCIKEGFVSTAGRFVNEFEKKVKELTKSKHAVAVVNGTAAIQIALKLVGVIAIIDSLIFKIPELYKLFNISSTSSLRESPF